MSPALLNTYEIQKMKNVDWGKTRAVFTLITPDKIEIKNMRLVNGINGFFVSPPSQKGSDDKYYPMIWIPKELQPQILALAEKEFDPNGQPVQQKVEDEIPF